MQHDDGIADRRPIRRLGGRGNAVALIVQPAAHLVEVALPLNEVLNGARLGEVGVSALAHPLNGAVDVVDVHLLVGLHGVVHALVGGVVRVGEELVRAAALLAAIGNLRLLRQVLDVADGRRHAREGEGGGQVGGVGADDD